jgi:hypothetical protein
MFGLASKAAHKSHHTEVLLCEMVCEVHSALLLVTLSLPPAQHFNCFVLSVAIFNMNGT